MNRVGKMFCRAYQGAFHMALPVLPYREPKLFSSVSALGRIFSDNGVSKVMVVTDRALHKMGALDCVKGSLEKYGIAYVIYDRTCANPTIFNVEEAREMYLNTSCGALVAFGGGSSIDCAKAVGARIAYPKKSLDQLKGNLKVIKKIPLLVAIPTTAGTGSEVTLTAVITDPDMHYKYTMNSFALIPQYAILDPSVTYSLPPSLTATTGMDALTHAVEAYIGRSTSKATREMALTATKLIFENLEQAYNDGTSRKARLNMLKASYLAGNAFSQSYVGYIHAIAHSLGGRYGTPHGFANAVILPIMLEAYGDSVYGKLRDLAVAAGVADETDSDEIAAKRFIIEIKKMNERMNIPSSIRGIKAKDIPDMARYAAKEANPLYPVPVIMDAEELENFYHIIMDKEDRKSIACS